MFWKLSKRIFLAGIGLVAASTIVFAGQMSLLGAGTITVSTTPPVATFLGAAANSSNGQTQALASGFSSTAAPRRMVIATAMQDSGTVTLSSATFTPNVGTAKAGIIVEETSVLNFPHIVIFYAVLDADADTATSITVSITLNTNPFVAYRMAMWTVPSANVSSFTATHNKNTATATTSVSTTVATTSGGFAIAGAAGSGFNTPATWSITGTEAWVTDTATTSGTMAEAGSVSGVSTNASSTVNGINFTSANLAIAVAAWR